nr:hypothetical protein B0A51_16966 [Rachicladosporium sp. CCFEE 5018]
MSGGQVCESHCTVSPVEPASRGIAAEMIVPNLEDTNVLDEFIDCCYEVRMGYGGMDKWTVDPPSWNDHETGKADHETKKAYCSTYDGIYDINGGTWDNY